VVRVPAAPARIEDGGGKQERGGAREEIKASGEDRSLHECAVRVWGKKIGVGQMAFSMQPDFRQGKFSIGVQRGKENRAIITAIESFGPF
jgi:hypothetical protein